MAQRIVRVATERNEEQVDKTLVDQHVARLGDLSEKVVGSTSSKVMLTWVL